ncbi:hypothetical protein IFM89_007428 [Coptis chinensis]|uniref:Uncharacterized protein n=1 Tax=Coptis chinensis TaxID=261450 RepID=A0A835I884_9MAGN|nr:hypothetical protein IFM89_007428 [Coptis chinensis]
MSRLEAVETPTTGVDSHPVAVPSPSLANEDASIPLEHHRIEFATTRQVNILVSTFQRLVNTLGTPKDIPELRDKL